MQCPCGAETVKSVSKVLTKMKAMEWTKGKPPKSLPVYIDQDKCSACRRIMYKVYSGGKVMYEQS